MTTSTFNIETLEQLSFSRCKLWGNILRRHEDKVADRSEEEIDVQDIEKVFAGEDVDEEDDGSNDEAEECDVSEDSLILKNITNSSHSFKVANQTFKHSIRAGDDNDVVVQYSENNNMELQNLLDQTLPVLQEHKRRLKESGIDRVLNTFDPQKIEEKVGGWLRRQYPNTISAPTTAATSYRHQDYRTRFAGDSQRGSHRPGVMSPITDSEAESLHSVDTARYIRSSRRHQQSQKRISSSCATMTIKTFRLVKSKRDKLRQKYTVCDDDDSQLTEVHHRRYQTQKSYAQVQADLGLSAGSRKIVKVRPQRTKVLRKRHLNTHWREMDSYLSSSCSNSSEEDDVCDNLHHGCCVRASNHKAVPCKQSRALAVQCRALCCRRSRGRVCQLSFTSSSSTSFVETQPGGRKLKRLSKRCAAAEEADARLWKRESDCYCCNDQFLCRDVRHLAETSTEEWLVENNETPKKALRNKAIQYTSEPPKLKKLDAKSNKSIYFSGSRPRSPSVPDCGKPKMKGKGTLSRNSKDNAEKQHSYSEEQESGTRSTSVPNGDKPQTRSKYRPPKHSMENAQKEQSYSEEEDHIAEEDSDFLDELQVAIQNSKKTFEMEKLKLSARANEKAAAGENDRHSRVGKEPAASAPTPHIPHTMTKQPAQVGKRQSPVLNEESKLELAEKSLKPQPKSAKQRKLAKLTEVLESNDSINYTFDAQGRNIYNSTAICSETPSRKQFSNNGNRANSGNKTSVERPTKSSSTSSQGAAVTTTVSSANLYVMKKKSAKSHAHVTSTNAESTASINTSAQRSTTAVCTPQTPKAMPKPRATSKTARSEASNYNDCTVVSSTTGSDSNVRSSAKGILLYTPNNKSMAPAHSFRGGLFHVTEEHLRTIIGAKAARKFMKYHIGRRKFDSNARVYFRPPNREVSDDSDSDADIFESVGQYGELHVSLDSTDSADTYNS